MKLTAKLLSLLLALAMLMGMTAGLAESDAVELNIFCSLASNSGVDANNLWWWRYAEYRLAQKGINVKLNVTGAIGEEATTGKALRLGSGNLPDIMWGFTMSGPEIVLYGDGDGVMLDFTPYLNETDMPNAYKCSQTNGAEEIFCDDASRLQLLERVGRGRMLPMLVIFLCVMLPGLLRSIAQGEGVLAALLGIIVGLYIYFFARFFCRYRQIKDRNE